MRTQQKQTVTVAMLLIVTSAFVAASGRSEDTATNPRQEVNVYTHRHYQTDQELFELFEEQTGIKVNVVQANADELIERLKSEGDRSLADLLITVDAGRLHRAKSLGLLQSIASDTLSSVIPPHLRDPDGQWYALTRRARVIVYSKDRVNPAELDTYADLAGSRWKDRILVRSSSNIYNQSLMAAVIAHDGVDGAARWAEGLVGNMARQPKGNDRDQIKAIVAGEGDVAIVNTYYVGLLLTSQNAEERSVGEQIGVFFPDQEGRGTHINVSGAGVTRSSRNRANAVRLIEFLVGDVAQRRFADANFEYPAREDVPPSPILSGWGDFKADNLSLANLGEHFSEAVRVFDQAGWR